MNKTKTKQLLKVSAIGRTKERKIIKIEVETSWIWMIGTVYRKHAFAEIGLSASRKWKTNEGEEEDERNAHAMAEWCHM